MIRKILPMNMYFWWVLLYSLTFYSKHSVKNIVLNELVNVHSSIINLIFGGTPQNYDDSLNNGFYIEMMHIQENKVFIDDHHVLIVIGYCTISFVMETFYFYSSCNFGGFTWKGVFCGQ